MFAVIQSFNSIFYLGVNLFDCQINILNALEAWNEDY